FPGRQMSPGQPATTDRPLATGARISGHTPREGRVYKDEGHVVTSERRAAMRTFEIQGIEIDASFNRTFAYVAEARNLPEWTGAFKRVYDGRALMETPNGAVEVSLFVESSREQGTIDWLMRFPDGSAARAYSRLVAAEEDRSLYTFILMAPPVPLERLEGALEEQSRILRGELVRRKRILESRHSDEPPSRGGQDPPLEQLVSRARQGDRAGLEELISRIQNKVYALALRMLWHPEDARDATQDIMIRVVTHLSDFGGRSAFLTWVYRIASNYLLTVRHGR